MSYNSAGGFHFNLYLYYLIHFINLCYRFNAQHTCIYDPNLINKLIQKQVSLIFSSIQAIQCIYTCYIYFWNAKKIGSTWNIFHVLKLINLTYLGQVTTSVPVCGQSAWARYALNFKPKGQQISTVIVCIVTINGNVVHNNQLIWLYGWDFSGGGGLDYQSLFSAIIVLM